MENEHTVHQIVPIKKEIAHSSADDNDIGQENTGTTQSNLIDIPTTYDKWHITAKPRSEHNQTKQISAQV